MAKTDNAATGSDGDRKEVRWVTIKVRTDTKRLLDLIALLEERSLADLEDELARERWQRVKQSDLLP
jgi:hypothetical protein